MIFKFYLIVGGIHYGLDSCVKAYSYGPSLIYEGCKFIYFMHHVCTVVMFRSMWMLDHYTWFIALPASYHCMLVAFPRWEPWNSYIYAVALIFFFFHIALVAPFNTNRVHLVLLLKFCIIIVPICFMATMDCQAQWDLNAIIKENGT